MADIRDYEKFIKGRWKWTGFGYEEGFPRGCQFSDIDAITEFDGRALVIEAKEYAPPGILPEIKPGQMRLLRHLAQHSTVYVVWGIAQLDEPWALKQIYPTYGRDRFENWRDIESREKRHQLFKDEIDWALGVGRWALEDGALCHGSASMTSSRFTARWMACRMLHTAFTPRRSSGAHGTSQTVSCPKRISTA